MRRIDRYIVRQLALTLFAVTVGLAALVWLTQSLRFIELVLDRGLSFWVFLELTGLLLPGFFGLILPITTFVVVLFTYVRLAGDRELVVMRAAGLSNWQLTWPAMVVATGSMLLCFLLNLWITPLAQQAFREWQFEIRNQMAGLLLQDGVFSQLGSDLMVYARDRDGANNLFGILVHDTRERGVPVTIIAETGRLTTTPQGPRVTLINGQRQQVDMVTGPDGVRRPRLTTLSFQENSLDLARATRAEGDRFRNAHERSLMELLSPDEDVSARDRQRYRAEAHQRLANPLTAVGLALLALAVALTGEFRRFGGGLRLFAGCAVMVALLAVGLTLGSAAARQNVLIPLVWVHAVLPGLVSAWVIAGTPGLARRLRQWAS